MGWDHGGGDLRGFEVLQNDIARGLLGETWESVERDILVCLPSGSDCAKVSNLS